MRRRALFPLPVVLFPGTAMPLHIFEPRYRQMVARCIEMDGRFGLVYHDASRLGAFGLEVDRIGTIVEIDDFRILPDGRSLIMTHGEERFRIVDGIESETPYHEGLLEAFEDEPPEDSDALVTRRRSSIRLFTSVVERLRKDDDPLTLPALDPMAETSFRIAERLPLDPQSQQELLELDRELARLDRIDFLLSRVLFEAQEPD